jgi:hypothetical protein
MHSNVWREEKKNVRFRRLMHADAFERRAEARRKLGENWVVWRE